MPATSLPALADLEGSGSTPNSAAFRLAIGNLRRYLSFLLGDTGTVATARAALGMDPVSGDCLQTRVAKPSLGPASSNSLITLSTAPVFTPKSTASLILVKCSVSYSMPPADIPILGFGIYQDSTSLFSYSCNTQTSVFPDPGNPSPTYLFTGFARDAGVVTLSAIISNGAVTARNFFLKASNSNLGADGIRSALWEISEYVA
jgi:hypothetical protein